MKDYLVHIFDLDGVIYLGNQAIPGAIEYLNDLHQRNKKIYFFTNNASKTPQQVADKISQLGYSTLADQIISSVTVTEHYLKNKNYQTAYIFGEEGLKTILSSCQLRDISVQYSNHELQNNSDIQCDLVIAGINRHATYHDIATASLLIQRGAHFLATNIDPSLPLENGLFPGAGAMIKAIELASGIPPQMVFGKPNPIGVTTLMNMHNFSPSECIFYGDRMDTDIACGHSAHIDTALLLTGAMSRKDIKKFDFSPTYVIESFLTLL